jgi:hypothetical protein
MVVATGWPIARGDRQPVSGRRCACSLLERAALILIELIRWTKAQPANVDALDTRSSAPSTTSRFRWRTGYAPSLDRLHRQRVTAGACERRSIGLASHWPFEDWGRFLPVLRVEESVPRNRVRHRRRQPPAPNGPNVFGTSLELRHNIDGATKRQKDTQFWTWQPDRRPLL